MAAPKMRKLTRLVLDSDLSAIFPSMGHVPNIICTAMRARWGVVARCIVGELELIWAGFIWV
jgi:hypothetical protein